MSPFYELKDPSFIANEVIQHAMQSTDWVKYYNFDATQIPNDILMMDDLFVRLSANHKLIAGVVGLPPHSFYNWHRDTRRGVSINMVLNFDGLSHCMFTDDKDALVGNFVELKYEPNRYYLFNNQVDHIIFNYEHPRFLLTVEFAEDKDTLTYDDLLLELL